MNIFNKPLMNILISSLFLMEWKFIPHHSWVLLVCTILFTLSNSPCSYAWRINITKTNNKSCRNIISKGSSYLSATHYLLTYAFNNNLFLPCSTNYCSQMNCFTSRLDWTPLPKRSRLLWKDIGRSNRMTKCLQCGPSYHVRYDERTKGCSIRNNSCNSSHKEAGV